MKVWAIYMNTGPTNKFFLKFISLNKSTPPIFFITSQRNSRYDVDCSVNEIIFEPYIMKF